MDRATAVVNDQSFLQVGSDTDVILLRMGFASDEIDVFHKERNEVSPPSLRRRACYERARF